MKITESLGGPTYSVEIPAELEEYYDHYVDCYNRCLKIESTLTTLEMSTGYPCFPATIGRRPSSALTDTPTQGKENVSPAGHSPLAVSGQIKLFQIIIFQAINY